METIAVYWEENIRTYGFQVEKSLCLVQADILPEGLESLGRQLADLGNAGLRFRLVLAHQAEPERLHLYLVGDSELKNRVTGSQPPPLTSDVRHLHVDHPVEMLNFHGPHYGDRYDIAHKASHALKKEGIRFIVTGCSAASVYFVFPENTADRAAKALGTVFKTP